MDCSSIPELFLYTEKEVKRIIPISINHSNIGEPYRELVQFNFTNEKKEDYLQIDPQNLQDLVNMLNSIGFDLPIPDRLCRYLDSYDDE